MPYVNQENQKTLLITKLSSSSLWWMRLYPKTNPCAPCFCNIYFVSYNPLSRLLILNTLSPVCLSIILALTVQTVSGGLSLSLGHYSLRYANCVISSCEFLYSKPQTTYHKNTSTHKHILFDFLARYRSDGFTLCIWNPCPRVVCYFLAILLTIFTILQTYI